MKLAEVAHITETRIEDSKTISGAFSASFDGLSIRGGGVLTGAVGFGASKREARKWLALKVSEKTVIASRDGVRTNFPLPKVTP